ncbi:MAG: hypothetical protein J3K34DRAFT_428103 [Monoraphidium minutum]|nr:MAG: hypothetical protein J3K34DRAFT_428103 [Monoraphidium minutum]
MCLAPGRGHGRTRGVNKAFLLLFGFDMESYIGGIFLSVSVSELCLSSRGSEHCNHRSRCCRGCDSDHCRQLDPTTTTIQITILHPLHPLALAPHGLAWHRRVTPSPPGLHVCGLPRRPAPTAPPARSLAAHPALALRRWASEPFALAPDSQRCVSPSPVRQNGIFPPPSDMHTPACWPSFAPSSARPSCTGASGSSLWARSICFS